MDNETSQFKDMFKEFFEREKRGKLEAYHILNRYVKKGEILFVGSSLMEQFPIYEFVQDYDIRETIYNRGIGGFTTLEMLQNMDVMVFDLEPSKIFINIGTNDLNDADYSKENLIENYKNIVKQIQEQLPNTKIYIMAYYPVNWEYDFGNAQMRRSFASRTNTRINEANEALEVLAQKYHVKYININKNLYDEKENLKHEFSFDGMHMYANGYQAIIADLMKYVRE